ncbi:LicD family protein [Desulfitobacterium metallireducens]|uniref:LICD n=1 Tax=Desulfitobacterium metallireducens DSM 15288 TaxID=871968 RepID=W0EF45_9FIRM|nr:LicD family protein [Desulfitobacterium metallireducens]AHF07666.1 LICD [Desulfitobacterium metallireducens DSM 15288]
MGNRGEYGTELNKVQSIILSIFKEIVRICDENDIIYFIINGTALGAVRHGGFIPWDDDIDIGMTRENYDHFLSIAQEKLPQDLFLQTVETEPNSPFYCAKVRKNGTKFIEEYCANLNINHGVFVDIFPFDNIPDNLKQRKKHHLKVNIISNFFIAKCLTGSSKPQHGVIGGLKIAVRKLLHIVLILVPKKILYRKLDLECQEYNQTPSKVKAFVKYSYLQIPSIDLEKVDRISFEGVEVNCPGHVNSYLKHHYGDYMMLPPSEKRVGHRPYSLEF